MIRTARVGETIKFTLSGELDLSTAPVIHHELQRALLDSTKLFVDLEMLRFLDSSGIQVLVRISRACRERGIEFVLRPGGSQPKRVLQLAGLLGVLSEEKL